MVNRKVNAVTALGLVLSVSFPLAGGAQELSFNWELGVKAALFIDEASYGQPSQNIMSVPKQNGTMSGTTVLRALSLYLGCLALNMMVNSLMGIFRNWLGFMWRIVGKLKQV